MFVHFLFFFFFFNDTATTEIYTLSLHDALPISEPGPYCGRLFIGYHDCPPPICSKGTSPSKRKGASRPEVVCNQCVAASELRSESLGLHHYEICVVD